MEWYDIFKMMKGKTLQPTIQYYTKLSFSFNGEIKRFTDKQKLREFSTTKPALQQMLKGLLQVEKKATSRNKKTTNGKAQQ